MYESTSSDVRFFNSSVATCVLFPRSHRVTGIELCKKNMGRDYMKCKTIGIRENGKLCVKCEVKCLFGSLTGIPMLLDKGKST